MNLKRRVAELERNMGQTAITLRMADGSTRQVQAGRLFEMLGECGQGVIKQDLQDVIASVSDNEFEMAGGRLIEVVKAFAVGEVQMAALTPERAAALDRGENEGMKTEGYLQ